MLYSQDPNSSLLTHHMFSEPYLKKNIEQYEFMSIKIIKFDEFSLKINIITYAGFVICFSNFNQTFPFDLDLINQVLCPPSRFNNIMNNTFFSFCSK